MLILWSLQKKLFFNADKYYFITKFREINSFNHYNTYWEFLGEFFKRLSRGNNLFSIDDKYLGKITSIYSIIFIVDYISSWSAISIPDDCFYQDQYADIENVLYPKYTTDIAEIPLLNLFSASDWYIESFDGFVFGSLFERFIIINEGKGSGTYYTPKLISEYICKRVLESSILNKLTIKCGNSILSIDKFIEDADQTSILEIFSLLKELKILDPSVGSGHFLEIVIKELLTIYEKLWSKIRFSKMNVCLEVQTLTDQGTILPINLLDTLSIEYFKFLVVMYIILPKNIYGTDINAFALNIAKARLSLILTDLFIQSNNLLAVPQIKFNLYEGNAIFGQTNLKPSNFSLMDVKNQYEFSTKYNKFLSKLDKDLSYHEILQNFLIQAFLSLGHRNSFIESILSPKDYDVKLLTNLFLFNYELTKIVNMSLTTSFYYILVEFNARIKIFLNELLAMQFTNLNRFNLDDVLISKPTFWSCIFPEVFSSTEPGFNIIIGNPPYGARLGDIEKIWLRKNFVSVNGIELVDRNTKTKTKLLGDTNTAIAFTELAEHLSCKESYIGLIVPKSILYVKSWQTLRYFLIKNTCIDAIIDISKAFVNVKLEEVIIFYSKTNTQAKSFILCGKFTSIPEKIIFTPVNRKYFSLERFLISMNSENEHIYRSIIHNTIELGQICANKRGSENNKFKQDKKFEHAITILDGKNLQPYYIRSKSYMLAEHIQDKPYYTYGTVIIQRIVAHVKHPLPHIIITATLNPGYPNVNTVVNIFAHPYTKIRSKVLALLLNSEIVSWYTYLFIFSEAVRSMDLWGTYLDHIRIPDIHQLNNYYECMEKVFEIISLYTTYVARSKKHVQEDKEIIEYFKEIANLLAYEKYLGKELDSHLFEVLQKIPMDLQIDFDTWYQSEQFDTVESWTTYIEKIKIFYYQIRDNKELKKDINSINTHPMVRYIRKNFK